MVTITKEEEARLDYMNSTIYIVAYPMGDRSKLCVDDTQRHSVYDYDLASNKEFDNEKEAIQYAKELASQHNLTFVCYRSGNAILD